MTADRRNMTGAEIEAEALAKLNEFSELNKPLAQRLHQLIMEADPSLHPRLWYGMPGYAKTKDSAVLLFFREDEKYMTFGFTDAVDVKPADGEQLVPCAWFFTKLDDAAEQKIMQIVRSATAA